jgi:drug/metabolite transporter (DMT)-like permease
VRWHRRDGQAKVAGIVICCAGAILMTFYKGPVVLGAKPTSTLEAASTSMIKEPVHLPGSGIPHTTIDGWQIGVLCLIGNCLCMGTNINLQVPVLRRFPAPVSLIAYSYAFGTVFMGIAAIFLVNDTSAWALSWDMNLVAILYNGIISSALNLAIMTWALSKVGPLFVASYIPLQPVSATVLALIFLKSSVYLGSILGTLMIILGLLSVSWAHQESARYQSLSEVIGRSVHSHDHQLAGTHGLDYRTPLLQGYP